MFGARTEQIGDPPARALEHPGVDRAARGLARPRKVHLAHQGREGLAHEVQERRAEVGTALAEERVGDGEGVGRRGLLGGLALNQDARRARHLPREPQNREPKPRRDDARFNSQIPPEKRGYRDDLGPAPVGFGDEMPAFMLIDAKV